MDIRSPVICLLLLCALPAYGTTVRYAAGVHVSEWKAETGKNTCNLRHKIPDYGEAEFIQGDDTPLALILSTHRHAATCGKSVLRSLPPSWKAGSPIEEIGSVRRMFGKELFVLGENMTTRLLAELEAGMTPAFFFQPDKKDKEYQVELALVPVNFSQAYNEFQACTSKLPVYRSKQLINSAIYFNDGSSELSLRDKAKLASVVEQFRSKRAYKKIQLTGYTDGQGQKADNLIVSQKRADAVKEFLVRLGISKKRIIAIGKGEIDKIVLNKTPELRARNRRVEIKFLTNTSQVMKPPVSVEPSSNDTATIPQK